MVVNKLHLFDLVHFRRVCRNTADRPFQHDFRYLLRALPEYMPIHDLLADYVAEVLKPDGSLHASRCALLERIVAKLVRNPDAIHETKVITFYSESYDGKTVLEKRSMTAVKFVANICSSKGHARTRPSGVAFDVRAQRAAGLFRAILEFGMNISHHGLASIVKGLRASFAELFRRYFDFDFGDWWVNYVFLHPQVLKFRAFRERHCATISAGIEANFHKYVARVRASGSRVIAFNEPNADKEAYVASLNDLPVKEQTSKLLGLAEMGQMRQETPCDLVVALSYFIIDGYTKRDDQSGLVQQLCLELSAGPVFDCMELEHLMLCAPEVQDAANAISRKRNIRLPDFGDLVQAAVSGRSIEWPYRSYPW